MNTQTTIALPPIERHIRSAMAIKGLQNIQTFLRRISVLQAQFVPVPEQCSPISLAVFLDFFAQKRTGFGVFAENTDEENGTFFHHYNMILSEYERYCSRFAGTEFDMTTIAGLANVTALFYEAAFIAAYMKNKRILYIKSELVESIAECPFPAKTPARTLRYLPFPAFAFVVEGAWYSAHYDYAVRLTDFQHQDPNSPKTTEEMYRELHAFFRGQALGEALNFSCASEGYDTENLVLHVNKFNTEAKLLVPFCDIITSDEQMQSQIFTFGEYIEPSDPEIRKIINTLLYIAGSDDIVQRVGHTFTPRKKDVVRKERESVTDKRALAEPEIFDSGLRFAGAIQHYAKLQAEEGASEHSEGKSMRPHIRRAHPHLYWKNDATKITEDGKPAKIPVVHYLPPVAVKGAVEDSVPVIIHQVR